MSLVDLSSLADKINSFKTLASISKKVAFKALAAEEDADQLLVAFENAKNNLANSISQSLTAAKDWVATAPQLSTQIQATRAQLTQFIASQNRDQDVALAYELASQVAQMQQTLFAVASREDILKYQKLPFAQRIDANGHAKVYANDLEFLNSKVKGVAYSNPSGAKEQDLSQPEESFNPEEQSKGEVPTGDQSTVNPPPSVPKKELTPVDVGRYYTTLLANAITNFSKLNGEQLVKSMQEFSKANFRQIEKAKQNLLTALQKNKKSEYWNAYQQLNAKINEFNALDKA